MDVGYRFANQSKGARDWRVFATRTSLCPSPNSTRDGCKKCFDRSSREARVRNDVHAGTAAGRSRLTGSVDADVGVLQGYRHELPTAVTRLDQKQTETCPHSTHTPCTRASICDTTRPSSPHTEAVKAMKALVLRPYAPAHAKSTPRTTPHDY